ncbi:hypothetical protein [Bacteroides sp.]|uniref:hypothetical protein n=1 Tax=Bacteroides sp. TaxID=29523 RepID=UPI00261F68F4|nr:hypothetical protein [Bacteroides sp.]MDD3041324.1 hypothetical protein [Bacteroides sp.]
MKIEHNSTEVTEKYIGLTEDRKDEILITLAENLQEVLDNGGGGTMKMFTNTFTYEGELLETVAYEGVELEIYFIDSSHFEIPGDRLESVEDLDTYAPIVRFKGNVVIEFDMWTE